MHSKAVNPHPRKGDDTLKDRTERLVSKLRVVRRIPRRMVHSAVRIAGKAIRAKSERVRHQKKILVLGGWGNRNAGDEAILHKTLGDLRSRYPDHIIRVLTPDQNYTHVTNDQCDVADAPRVAFFDQDERPLYYLECRRDKFLFALRMIWIYGNAVMDRRHLPVFLGVKRTALLHEIKTASLVFFAGGGYLTGATLSRLWDGCLFILLCKLYRVPVVLSGQTIGLWNNWFDRFLAGRAFRYAKLITVRDPEASLKALAQIGVPGSETVYTTCDDALFCEKEADPNKIHELLVGSGMSDADIANGFVAVNISYWGTTTEEDKGRLRERFQKMLQHLLERTEHCILFVPMNVSDEESMNDVRRELRSDRVFLLKTDYDFKSLRGVIGRSEMCLTRRHHPIIFAIGERVPVIALAYHPYFEHKNFGALHIVNWGEFSVSLTDDDCVGRFQQLWERISADRKGLIGDLDDRFRGLHALRERFFEQVSAFV